MKPYLVIESKGVCRWFSLTDVACWFASGALITASILMWVH